MFQLQKKITHIDHVHEEEFNSNGVHLNGAVSVCSICVLYQAWRSINNVSGRLCRKLSLVDLLACSSIKAHERSLGSKSCMPAVSCINPVGLSFSELAAWQTLAR